MSGLSVNIHLRPGVMVRAEVWTSDHGRHRTLDIGDDVVIHVRTDADLGRLEAAVADMRARWDEDPAEEPTPAPEPVTVQ